MLAFWLGPWNLVRCPREVRIVVAKVAHTAAQTLDVDLHVTDQASCTVVYTCDKSYSYVEPTLHVSFGVVFAAYAPNRVNSVY